MKLSQAIRTGVYGALDGNVLYQGSPVSVFDSFADPKEDDFFYILLSSQDQVERAAKNRRPSDATLVIQVITVFDDPVGRSIGEGIMDQVDQIVNPVSRAQLDITANGWKIADTRILNSGNTEDRREEKYVYREITTYGFLTSRT